MNNTGRSTRRLTGGLITTGLLAAALVGGAGSASAHGGGGDDGKVRATGSCSAGTHQKLVAGRDDGRIEVELEVDADRAGETWHVTMSHDGSRFLSRSRVTRGRSGSFEISRRVVDRAGKDRITAVATHAGERCTATVVVGGAAR
jgi:hypothetical protein